MELVTEPEVYIPFVDNNGNYIDNPPNFNVLPNGLRCNCGCRKDKYINSRTFASHMKTQTHQKWLLHLTANKANYYKENEENKITIYNQKQIIAQLEVELNNRTRTINYLTSQLVSITPTTYTNVVDDLIDFD
jgi:hypothetical protein